MKKLLGAILILISLSGCDGKSSNADPKYAGIDDATDKIIDLLNQAPGYKGYSDVEKLVRAKELFSNVVRDAPGFLSERCTEEKFNASYEQLVGHKVIHEVQFHGIMAFIPFVCENGVLKKEIYEEQSNILKSYADKRFTDEFGRN